MARDEAREADRCQARPSLVGHVRDLGYPTESSGEPLRD